MATIPHLEQLSWKDVANQVKALDCELYDAIVASNYPAHFSLFKATYPYGADILKEGVFYLPNSKGELVSLEDASIPIEIQNKLTYHHEGTPPGFILKGSVDIFLAHQEHLFSIPGPILEGGLIGSSLALSEEQTRRFRPAFLWHMVAGLRSLLLLPKMTEALSLERLDKNFKMDSRALTSQSHDHWQVFPEIAKHLEGERTWSMEVLFFSREWYDWDQTAATPFKNLIYERSWRNTEFWRNEFLWDMVFSIFLTEKMAKVNPFIADTAKHLMYIAIGAQPGFAPCNDERLAPISAFQEVLRDIYHLETAPIFMGPEYFDIHKPKPVYYSLSYPNSLEFAPNSRKASTKIDDLLDLSYFLKKYQAFLQANSLKLEDSSFYEAAQCVKFQAFHNAREGAEVHSIEDLLHEDSRFEASVVKARVGQKWLLPKHAPFLTGSIKIS